MPTEWIKEADNHEEEKQVDVSPINIENYSLEDEEAHLANMKQAKEKYVQKQMEL